MPLPASVTTVPVHIKIVDKDGNPGKGRVAFTGPYALRDTTGNVVVGPPQYSATLDATGEATVSPIATDDPDLSPSGWAYTVSVATDVWRDTFQIQVPYATVGTLELADIPPAVTPTPTIMYALVSEMAGKAAAVQIPASNGTDDTATINALLTANAGKRVRGLPGQTYLISAPLVIYSGTELDMTACGITLKANSNCNMVQNGAVGTVRRFLDAVTTSGSPAFTSATAAFVAGDVGKPVTIQGAGAGGVPLTTTISAVTNPTTATLAANAGSSVTGQYAAIGARDSNITVIGGRWDRGANNSIPANGVNAHNLRFRHVDNLTVRGTRHASTSGKYGINPGDCTMVRVADSTFPAADWSSDGVHINGPASQVVITNTLAGQMHDDLVSITARDSTAVITDCAGDITNVVVENAQVMSSIGFTSALKIVAGKTTDGSADYTVRNVVARNLTGSTQTAAVAFVGDSSGGNLLDIVIDGIRSLGGGAFPAADIHGGSTIDRISLSRIRPHIDDSYPVSVNTGLTVGRLSVSDVTWDNSSASAVAVFGTVNRLIVDRVQANVPGGGQSIVRLNGAAASVVRLILGGVQFDAAGGANNTIVSAETSGQTVGTVHLANIQTAGVHYPLGAYVGTPTVHASNVTSTGMTAWARTLFGGVVTIKGAGGLSGDADTTGGNLLVAVLGNVLNADPSVLVTGEETIPRLLVSGAQAAATGQLLLTYFTARKTETIGNTRTFTEATAAAGGTLARVGVYSVAANGDLTLVASTVNDTTLWAGTFATYTRALTASWAKQAGQRYALGVLFVGTTGPKLRAIAPVNGGEDGQPPRLNGSVAGQADLPSSITAATVTNSQGISVYAALVP